MRKILGVTAGAMFFGMASMLVACSDDTSVSPTSSESIRETDYLTIDTKNQILTTLASSKGVCLLDNHKITWNSNPFSYAKSFRYEISKDTLYLFKRSLDTSKMGDKAIVLVGDSKDIEGTWKYTNCEATLDDENEKVVTCNKSKNRAFERSIEISDSEIIEDLLQNQNFNFSYSEFVHDIFNVIDGDYEIEKITGAHLFESSDKNFDHFAEEHASDFKSINNRTAEFSKRDHKFEVIVDTAFIGLPSSMAKVRVISGEDTCSFDYELDEMRKSYCREKYSEGFDEATYVDAAGIEHEIASAYRQENIKEFTKCIRNIVKEDAAKDSTDKEIADESKGESSKDKVTEDESKGEASTDKGTAEESKGESSTDKETPKEDASDSVKKDEATSSDIAKPEDSKDSPVDTTATKPAQDKSPEKK